MNFLQLIPGVRFVISVFKHKGAILLCLGLLLVIVIWLAWAQYGA